MSDKDKEMLETILAKVEYSNESNDMMLMSLEVLYNMISKEEQNLLKKFFEIDPFAYGIKLNNVGIQEVPDGLVDLSHQKYLSKRIVQEVKTQYILNEVSFAFMRLNDTMFKDIKKRLLVASGYRSPAFQMITFLGYLYFNEFNFSKTLKRVALPCYSEHCYSSGHAVDFMTRDGLPSDEHPIDFSETLEYKWLLQKAGEFGFHLSFPSDNKLGIEFEPWHWLFKNPNIF